MDSNSAVDHRHDDIHGVESLPFHGDHHHIHSNDDVYVPFHDDIPHMGLLPAPYPLDYNHADNASLCPFRDLISNVSDL